MLSILSCAAQVEIDYKSECMAGQTVESLGSSTAEGHQRQRRPQVGPGQKLRTPPARNLANISHHLHRAGLCTCCDAAMRPAATSWCARARPGAPSMASCAWTTEASSVRAAKVALPLSKRQ